MPLTSHEKDNLTRWNPSQKGFYEIYYLKWNDVAQGVAGWIRYTLLTPHNRPVEISVWGLFFDTRDPTQNRALKQNYPLQESRIERDFFYFSGGPSAIFDSGARGVLANDQTRMSWELKFESPWLSLHHYPFPLYWGGLPKTKFLTPYLSMKLSGEFTIGDRKITLDKVPAHQGHLWGTEMAPHWTWGNCNTFEEDPDFIFEGLTAQIQLGHRLSPPMTLLFFNWEGELYSFHSPIHLFRNQSTYSLDRWHFEARRKEIMFIGNMSARLEEVAGVRYENPDGTSRYCHNSKTADLEIQVVKKRRYGWETVQALHAKRSAAFEVVQPTLDQRVRLVIP